MRRSRTPRRVAPGRSRNAGHKLAPSLLLAVSCLILAPVASAQSGGTGVDPVDGVVATVEYEVEQTLNSTNPPSNGTTPPGNGTNPPSNGTTPTGNGTNPPGNGTNPPGNGTTPPGNQTTSPDGNQTTEPDDQTVDPDGNSTTPDDNSTAPADNSTTPEDGNGTVDTGTNSTVTPAEGADNSTVDANVTASGSVGDHAGADGDNAADGETCGGCASEDGTEANSTVGDIGSSGGDSDGAGGSGGKLPCVGVACDRSRVIGGTPKPGFPMTPLLITLILGPLAGLVVAHYAIRRWNMAKPAKHGAVTVVAGPKGPVDAHDPMRQFLMDVKEWKAMPQPGAAPVDPAPGSV